MERLQKEEILAEEALYPSPAQRQILPPGPGREKNPE
jgi:hypothetical protein